MNPVLVPDKKLVYSLYLASAHTTGALPGGANVTTADSRTAIIEYSGVVVIAPDSQQLEAVEDGKVRVLWNTCTISLRDSQRNLNLVWYICHVSLTLCHACVA